MGFLDPQTMCTAALVSKAFLVLASSDKVWGILWKRLIQGKQLDSLRCNDIIPKVLLDNSLVHMSEGEMSEGEMKKNLDEEDESKTNTAPRSPSPSSSSSETVDDGKSLVSVKEAYRLALLDAQRARITKEDLIAISKGSKWYFRFKKAVGPAWYVHA